MRQTLGNIAQDRQCLRERRVRSIPVAAGYANAARRMGQIDRHIHHIAPAGIRTARLPGHMPAARVEIRIDEALAVPFSQGRVGLPAGEEGNRQLIARHNIGPLIATLGQIRSVGLCRSRRGFQQMVQTLIAGTDADVIGNLEETWMLHFWPLFVQAPTPES